MNTHIEVHTSIKKYSCDVCGKEVNQRSALVKHKKTHGPQRDSIVKVREFFEEEGYPEVKSDTECDDNTKDGQSDPVTCPICSKESDTMDMLITHIRANHSGSESTTESVKDPDVLIPDTVKKGKTTNCNVCEKELYVTSMTRHMRTHTREMCSL